MFREEEETPRPISILGHNGELLITDTFNCGLCLQKKENGFMFETNV
jgi:hypothetical protein